MLYKDEEDKNERKVTIRDVAKKSAKGVLMTNKAYDEINWNNERRNVKEMIEFSTRRRNILECRGSTDPLDIKHYKTFCEYVLVGMHGTRHFRDLCTIFKITEICSVSDEAFASLLLENNAEDLLKIYETKERIGPKMSNTKFTKNRQGREGTSGWTNSAVKKMIENIKIVKVQRATERSKLLDEELREYFCELYGYEMNKNEDSDEEEDYNRVQQEEDHTVYYCSYERSNNVGDYGVRGLMNTNNMPSLEYRYEGSIGDGDVDNDNGIDRDGNTEAV